MLLGIRYPDIIPSKTNLEYVFMHKLFLENNLKLWSAIPRYHSIVESAETTNYRETNTINGKRVSGPFHFYSRNCLHAESKKWENAVSFMAPTCVLKSPTLLCLLIELKFIEFLFLTFLSSLLSICALGWILSTPLTAMQSLVLQIYRV